MPVFREGGDECMNAHERCERARQEQDVERERAARLFAGRSRTVGDREETVTYGGGGRAGSRWSSLYAGSGRSVAQAACRVSELGKGAASAVRTRVGRTASERSQAAATCCR